MSSQESMCTIIRERIRQSFMKDDELSDATFIVGPEKVLVPGHKILLAFCSPVFQAQFYGPLSRLNNKEGQGPTTVEISDMEPKTFMNFMSFLYRDELTDGHEGTAKDYLDLLYPAHKYLVPALSRLCVQKLREKIQPGHVFQAYESAVLYDEIELKNWCLHYMDMMSKKIIFSPLFDQLEPAMLSVFLESDGLAASEQQIHLAVRRWAEFKVCRDGQERSRESMRNALGDLIYLIRFPTMSAMEFRKEQLVSVLRKEEIIEIWEQISCKDTSTESRFSTKKRRLNCNLYRCHPDDHLKPLAVMNARKSPCRRIRFKLRTDKRIFLKGVCVSSILYPYHFENPAHKFEIGLRVQVDDLRIVRAISQVNSDVVEPEMKIPQKRSRGPPASCPIRAIVLDEFCEVPANCVVAICVEVFVAGSSTRNRKIYYEVPLREEVQVDSIEDEKTVAFQFFSLSDELRVHAWSELPDILFSL